MNNMGGDDTIWRLRLAMAARGWDSKISLSSHRLGRPVGTFRAEFGRYEWHGRRCCYVSFYEQPDIDPTRPDEALAEATAAVVTAAERAMATWDEGWQERIPFQGMNAEIVTHGTETAYWAGRGWPMEAETVELLPADLATLCGQGGEAVARMALVFAALGWAWDDHLTWTGRNPGLWPTRRRWGVDFRVTPLVWHGVDICYKPQKHSVESADETMVSASVSAVLERAQALLAEYGPGAPLPAGLVSLDDMVRSDEEKSRRIDFEMWMEGDWDDRAGEVVLDGWRHRRNGRPALARLFPEPTLTDVRAAFNAVRPSDGSSSGPSLPV